MKQEVQVEKVKKTFEVDDVGPLEDYLGCKLAFDWERRSCKLTQPVHIKSMKDKHNANDVPAVTLPAQGEKVLPKNYTDSKILDKEEHKEYREIVGRIMHMTAWTRPDVAKAIREASRYGQQPIKSSQANSGLFMANTRTRMIPQTG